MVRTSSRRTLLGAHFHLALNDALRIETDLPGSVLLGLKVNWQPVFGDAPAEALPGAKMVYPESHKPRQQLQPGPVLTPGHAWRNRGVGAEGVPSVDGRLEGLRLTCFRGWISERPHCGVQEVSPAQSLPRSMSVAGARVLVMKGRRLACGRYSPRVHRRRATRGVEAAVDRRQRIGLWTFASVSSGRSRAFQIARRVKRPGLGVRPSSIFRSALCDRPVARTRPSSVMWRSVRARRMYAFSVSPSDVSSRGRGAPPSVGPDASCMVEMLL